MKNALQLVSGRRWHSAPTYLDRQGGGGGPSLSSLGFWQDGTSPSRLTCTITAGFPHAQRSPG